MAPLLKSFQAEVVIFILDSLWFCMNYPNFFGSNSSIEQYFDMRCNYLKEVRKGVGEVK